MIEAACITVKLGSFSHIR